MPPGHPPGRLYHANRSLRGRWEKREHKHEGFYAGENTNKVGSAEPPWLFSRLCGDRWIRTKTINSTPETSCLNTTQLARARTSESQKTDFHEQQVVRRVLRRTATRIEWACGLDKPSIHYFRGGSHDCARRRPALVDGGGGIQAHIYCSGRSVQGRRGINEMRRENG